MERDDVLPILVARHQVSVGVGGCHGHEAQRREVGLCCGPHLGTQSSGDRAQGTSPEGASKAGSCFVFTAASKNH